MASTNETWNNDDDDDNMMMMMMVMIKDTKLGERRVG